MMNLKQGRNTAAALALGAAVAFGATNVAQAYNVVGGPQPAVWSFYEEWQENEEINREFWTWFPGNFDGFDTNWYGINTVVPAVPGENGPPLVASRENGPPNTLPGFNYRDPRTGKQINVQSALVTNPQRPRRSVGIITVTELDGNLNPVEGEYREIPARGRGAARAREIVRATYDPQTRNVRFDNQELRVRAGFRVQGRLRKEGRIALVGRSAGGRQVVTNTFEGVENNNEFNQPSWNVQVRARLRRMSVSNQRFNNVEEFLPIQFHVAWNDPAEINAGRNQSNTWNGPATMWVQEGVSTGFLNSYLPRKGVRYRLPNRRFSRHAERPRLIARFLSPYGRVRTQNILVPFENPPEGAAPNPVIAAMRTNDILTHRYVSSAPGTSLKGRVDWTFVPIAEPEND